MSSQTELKLGWPDKPRAIALVVLFCLGGLLVWSFHHLKQLAFIATFVLSCIAGFLAGGLAGVPSISSLVTMFMFAGLIEGLVRGWTMFGTLGAILGGMIGIVVAVSVCMLLLMLVSFSIVLCGKDPCVNADLDQVPQTPERSDSSQ